MIQIKNRFCLKPLFSQPLLMLAIILFIVGTLTSSTISFGVRMNNAKYLFHDTFERQAIGSDWSIISGTWKIVEGKLVQTEITPIDNYIRANFSASDFIFEAKCKTVASPKAYWWEGHRIMFRANEETTAGYIFLHSWNGTVMLVDRQGYNPLFVADDRPFVFGEWETLKVKAIGSMIYCFLNDELLIDFNDTTYRYKEGYVALVASYASCEFDDVRVTSDVFPPTVSVSQFELLMKTGEGIVTASVLDKGSGIKEVNLFYSTSEGAGGKIPMKREASDYKGIIPGQSYRTLVSYYVEVLDNGLNRAKTGISGYEVGLTLRYLYIFVAPISGGVAAASLAVSLKFRKAKGGRVAIVLSSGVLLAFSLLTYTIPAILISVISIGLYSPIAAWKSARRRFAREQLARGLVEYKGRWGTPLQVEEWRKMDRGLVKYKGKWVTPQERFTSEQAEKGLVLFITRKHEESWGTPEQVAEWRKIDNLLVENFASLPYRKFEDFTAELLEKMGYQVEMGSFVKGVGRDIIATREGETVVVHAKRNKPSQRVNAGEIRQILARMSKYDANRSMIVTTSDFTDAARRLAKGAPIELWNRRDLHDAVDRYVFLRFVKGPPPRKAPPRKAPKKKRRFWVKSNTTQK